MEPLPSSVLPDGVRARILPGINGLDIHVLEAGFEHKGRPAVLLLHGFPELAYSWRKVLPALAAAGYHAIAPDHRGYGRTTGWDADYDGDLAGFRFMNLLRDSIGVLFALGHRTAEAVVGHDFGASIASLRCPGAARHLQAHGPDERAVRRAAAGALRHRGQAAGPSARHPCRAGGARAAAQALPVVLLDAARQREHVEGTQGVHDFLRAYYHHKSADWKANKPFELKGWTAEELAKMPTYYIMDLADGMAETVAKEMPSAAEIAANKWLTDSELRVYSDEYARTGFQGGLNWYRVRTTGKASGELEVFTGRTIDVPSTFISGNSDWGIYQMPGAIERMQKTACTNMKEIHLIDGAGHWVQQEQADEVNRLLLKFLKST